MKRLVAHIRERYAVYKKWIQGRSFQRRFHELLETRPYIQGIPYWASGFLVGIIAIIYSTSFSSSIEFTMGLAQQYPYLLFIMSPVCLTLSVWIVHRFSPDSGGTGVPKVSYALELNSLTDGGTIDRILSLKTATVVVASSLLAI